MDKSEFIFNASDGQSYDYEMFGHMLEEFQNAMTSYDYSLSDLVPESSDRDDFLQALREYEECGGTVPSALYSYIHSDTNNEDNTGDNENENDTTGDNLSDNEDSSETDTENVEAIDYTEALNSIYSKLDVIADTTRMQNETMTQLSDSYSEYVEYQQQSILDKPINDYTVGESLGLVIVSTVLLKTLIEMLERIWLKWRS